MAGYHRTARHQRADQAATHSDDPSKLHDARISRSTGRCAANGDSHGKATAHPGICRTYTRRRGLAGGPGFAHGTRAARGLPVRPVPPRQPATPPGTPQRGRTCSTKRGPPGPAPHHRGRTMTITVEQLSRSFGQIQAVKGIDLSIERGETFGFLGPNGAGQSTTIKILCTLLHPTSGRAWINGYDIEREASQVRQSIGIVFQDPTLDEYLTAEQNLYYHCMIYHTPHKTRATRINEVLELVGLEDRRKDIVKTFSGGMKRRLEVARGLLHEPQTLFLDEPTVGLDPQTRRSVWEHVLRLRDRTGLTIFMTTHYMEEAEYCDRIAIIDHGQIVALDTPAALKRMVGQDVVCLTTSTPERAAAILEQFLGYPVRRVDDAIYVEGENGQSLAAHLIRQLTLADIEVRGVNVTAPTLEDVFVHLTGRAIRDELASAKERLGARLRSRGRLRR